MIGLLDAGFRFGAMALLGLAKMLYSGKASNASWLNFGKLALVSALTKDRLHRLVYW